MHRCAGLLIVLILIPGRAAAAVALPDEVRSLAERIDHVQPLLKDGQWAEALDELQDILDKQGDALVPIRPGHLLPARRLIHQRLAALPPEALRLYRSRVDAQARKWLDSGSETRNERLLRRLVEETFCSRHTDQALDLLGDLAFERGELEQAQRYWQTLLPAAADAAPGTLTYPDPRTAATQVRAKQLLAGLFRRTPDRAQQCQQFRDQFGMEEGHLAGRSGNLAAILDELARQPDLLPAQPESLPWTTFAGAPSRTFTAPTGPRTYAFDIWRVRFDGGPVRPDAEEDKASALAASARSPTIHPVIVGERILVADHRSITAWDLRTGRRSFRWDLGNDLKIGGLEPRVGDADPDPSPTTLTVADHRVYARLGAPSGKEPGDSFLVCLSLEEDASLRYRWHAKAQLLTTDPAALFAGAPVVQANRAFAARLHVTGGQVTTAVACLDADSGEPRWSRDIASLPLPADASTVRAEHSLLTLAGPNVICCTHSGAVVALDAASGRPAWAVRYPSRGPRTTDGEPSPRDLAPAVYADGRLYVAPADCDHILCLDADTGRTLWSSKPVEVQHLLGVAQDRLIFTTATKPRGIRALTASTGVDLRTWLQPADGTDLPSYGRGFLAGDQVFWPTPYGLRILDQEDGQPAAIDPTRLRHIRPGNLAFGEGCLAVAGTQELTVYVVNEPRP